jgi:hypothetical protein
MPDVEQMTKDDDHYWSGRIDGLHASGHLLSFHGLYQGVYRTGSKPTHGSFNELANSYVDLTGPWPEVSEPTERRMLHDALSAPILGIALVVASQEFGWIDEDAIRR